jgi:hypothetical protein
MAKREAIAATLFTIVQAEAGKVVNLVTSSRKLRHFDSVKSAEMPALFQAQNPETYERTVADGPPKRTMHFRIWLYTADAQQPEVIPSQQINNMVDAIEAAFAPSPLTGMFTLGGLVHRCWIEGIIEIYEGVTSDGKSIAIIPIAVLMP